MSTARYFFSPFPCLLNCNATIVLFFSLLAWNTTVYAEEEIAEKHYEIEIMVFANNNEASREAENWQEQPQLPAINGSVELVNSFDLLWDESIEQLPFYYLEPDFATDQAFERYQEKLKNNPNYKVLLHRIWQQTVPDNSSGIPVYITAKSEQALYQIPKSPELINKTQENQEVGEQSEINTTSSADTDWNDEHLFMQALEEEQRLLEMQLQLEPVPLLPSDPIVPFAENPLIPESKPVPLSPMGPPEHRIYGTFRLSKSRFMHMSLDFVYRDREILSEYTVYPQIISEDQTIVDNFATMEFNTENTFLIPPLDTLSPSETNIGLANEELSTNKSQQPGLVNDAMENPEISVEPLLDPETEESQIAVNETENQLLENEEAAEKLLVPEKPPFLGYRLTNSKRVRISKVYYFDHPRFGVIVRVSRYTPPEEVAATDGTP